MKVLTVAVAHTVNAVQSPHDYASNGRLAAADVLDRALTFDMADWWRPTAANYFARIKKDQIRRSFWQRAPNAIQNTPFGLAAFFGSPISCNTSQCSIALPYLHLEDVNAGNPTVLWVVVKQINEMDVCPDIVVDGDDSVDHDSQISAILSHLVKKLASSAEPSGTSGLRWMYLGAKNLATGRLSIH